MAKSMRGWVGLIAVLLCAVSAATAAVLSGGTLTLAPGEIVEVRCAGRRLTILRRGNSAARLACRPIVATPAPSATAAPTRSAPPATPTATPSPTPPADAPASVAFGVWSPGRFDTCSKALHDSFSVIGPDGKRYPGWHPPEVVDPATGRLCTFGHEHGRDPHGSDLYAWLLAHFADPAHAAQAGIPFGYANETLDAWVAANGGHGHRHEDHVGHKIEWENDVRLLRTNAGGPATPIDVTCDLFAKIHQGTHSADAFGMNVHEVLFAARCSDGTELIATKMAAFGRPNELARSCERGVVVNAQTSHDMPSGGGLRGIPDRTCALRDWLVPAGQWSGTFYEFWVTGNYLRTAAGRQIAYFDPAFAVFDPSRYFDPAAPGTLRRVVDLCWEVEPNGDRARGGACDVATDFGRRTTPLAWDDPASPFTGTHRETYFSNFSLDNAGGPTFWFTDPYGGNASATPFAGSIRQRVAPIDDQRPTLESQALGANRDYGGHGVHAPN